MVDTAPSPRRTLRSVCATLAVGALSLGVVGAAGAAPATASTAPTGMVISQVYGGGGNIGGVLSHDFVELFNAGTQPVDVSGWSVQYAAGTGTSALGATVATRTAIPGGTTVQPGRYLLVRGNSGDQAGQPALPTADVTSANPIQLHESSGKVALVRQSASLGCNGASVVCTPAQLALVSDLVGYGTADFSETLPTAMLSPRTGALRNGSGCSDTGNNSFDFALATPAPRSSASPIHTCPNVAAEKAAASAEAQRVAQAAADQAATEAAAAQAEADRLAAEVLAAEAAARDEAGAKAAADLATALRAEADAAVKAAADLAAAQKTAAEKLAADVLAAEKAAAEAAAISQAAADKAAAEKATADAALALSCRVLQPVNCDGSSVFKLGSTVPVKFNAPELPAGAVFSLHRVSTIGHGHELEAVSTLVPSSGGIYRFDGGSHHHYNLSTKGLETGTYKVLITSGSGIHEARITLR